MELTLLKSIKHLAYPKVLTLTPGFSGSSDGKESACSAGELDLIPGSVRLPGEGNGNPLQYSCLENSMYRGACDHGVAKSQI